MPIYVVAPSRWCPAALSRYAHHVPCSSLRGRVLVEALKRLATSLGGRPVLMLSGDREVETISSFRDEIEPLYRLSLPAPEMVRTLLDKTLFQNFAEREGLPVPRALVLGQGADISGLRQLSLPLVIKPADKTVVLEGRAERVVFADTHEKAMEAATHMLAAAGSVLAQEWIEGEDTDIYFTLFVCDHESHVTALFCGRKLICDPPHVGSTAVCIEAADVAEALERSTKEFVACARYRGLGGVEFKRDRRTANFVVVEPTVGRTDWQEEIATLCGANIPLAAYETELGNAPVGAGQLSQAWRATYKPGVPTAWRSSIRHWIPAGLLPKDVRIYDGYFRFADPLPGAYHYLVDELWRRTVRRLRRALCLPPMVAAPAQSGSARSTSDILDRKTMASSETVIIGAGPYGLSVASHMRAAGLPHQIIGNPLESWRCHMPEGMLLRSEPFASNLWDPDRKYTLKNYFTRKAMPYRAVRDPVSLERFLEYAEWFRENAVGEVRDTKVRRMQRTAEGFSLELADGNVLNAQNVILATGHMAYRYLPPELEHLPEPLVLHSVRIGDINAYTGRRVLVVGAGQSALETAALLHERGARVQLLARAGKLKWNGGPNPNPSLIDRLRKPEAGLGAGWSDLAVSELPFVFRRMFEAEKRHRFFANSWGPSGAWWLRERFDGLIDVVFNSKIRSAVAANSGVQLDVTGPDGSRVIEVDHVIAGTGFEVDMDRIDYLTPELKSRIAREAGSRFPLLDSQFETSVRGLFMVGLISAPTFGPVMRFMFGAKHAAPVVVRRLKSITNSKR